MKALRRRTTCWGSVFAEAARAMKRSARCSAPWSSSPPWQRPAKSSLRSTPSPAGSVRRSNSSRRCRRSSRRVRNGSSASDSHTLVLADRMRQSLRWDARPNVIPILRSSTRRWGVCGWRPPRASDDRVALNKAIEALSSVADQPDATSEALTLYGRALLLSGNSAAAERVLRRATEQFPVEPAAFTYLAMAARRLGHRDAAREAEARHAALVGE